MKNDDSSARASQLNGKQLIRHNTTKTDLRTRLAQSSFCPVPTAFPVLPGLLTSLSSSRIFMFRVASIITAGHLHRYIHHPHQPRLSQPRPACTALGRKARCLTPILGNETLVAVKALMLIVSRFSRPQLERTAFRQSGRTEGCPGILQVGARNRQHAEEKTRNPTKSKEVDVPIVFI